MIVLKIFIVLIENIWLCESSILTLVLSACAHFDWITLTMPSHY